MGLRQLTGFERILAMAGFPIAVVATHAWAIQSMRRGMDPALATALPIPICYFALACLELEPDAGVACAASRCIINRSAPASPAGVGKRRWSWASSSNS